MQLRPSSIDEASSQKPIQAVLSLFGEEVVLSGDAAPEDGRLMNDLRDLRVQADYRHDPIDADVSRLFNRTETFVAEMSDLM